MKKTILFLVITIHALSFSAVAQAPQAIPYQAVARDASGNLTANQNIGLRFTILQGSIVPVELYKETQSVTTNGFGLFSANVGQGTPVLGTFSAINWGMGVYPDKYLKVELDATGGMNYIDMGQTQMLSVPYALYSANSGNGLSPGAAAGNTMYWNGFSWVNDGNLFNNGGSIGIGTTTPNAKLHINASSENMNMQLTGNLTGTGSFDGLKIGLSGTSPYIMNEEESDLTFGTFGTTRMRIASDGHIGIDATTPEFKLTIDNDGGILAKGAYNSGAVLTTSGPGTRLIWYPRQAAFRAGRVSANEWDDVNIGFGSFASGSLNVASGSESSAMGIGCTASAHSSFAEGNVCTATEYQAVAMGYFCNAYGIRSLAIGDQASANHQSRALGNTAVASGIYATAIGNFVTASGFNATAMGNYVSTNSHEGAFSIGDNSTTTPMTSTSDNSFKARFDGGYSLYSDAATTNANGMFLTGGKVGIGTNTPQFKLSLTTDGGILAKGTVNSGATLPSGGGTQMIWYPRKAAFRAGTVAGPYVQNWDDINVGENSVATGFGTMASGLSSTALGDKTTASGDVSTALGFLTVASGDYSTAIGNHVSTNNHNGALIIGDNSTTTLLTSQADNGFRARFDGGYRFFTNAACNAGVYLSNGDGAWNNISDKRMKENFKTVNTEDILQAVGTLEITSWKYKAQRETQRHLGCMAQDFYAAFHLNGEGNDTTINTLDIDGINMAAIQALKVRTDELKKATDKIDALTTALVKLEQRVDAIEKEYVPTASTIKNK